MDSVEVVILGQRYKIKGDTGSDYIKSLADFLNLKIQEIAQNSPPMQQQRLIILAALNMADELFKVKLDNEALKESLQKAIISIDAMCRHIE